MLLFERAAVWLRERKILLPGVSTLTRLISEVRAGVNNRLSAALINAAGPSLIQELEGLLRVAEDSRLTAWERLQTGFAQARREFPDSVALGASETLGLHAIGRVNTAADSLLVLLADHAHSEEIKRQEPAMRGNAEHLTSLDFSATSESARQPNREQDTDQVITEHALLLVEWEHLDDHTIGFRQSEHHQKWRTLLHHFYDPFPLVEHHHAVQ